MATRNLAQRVLGPYRISHHPFCEAYKDHVYVFRGSKLCRGCVMQYSGMIFSFLVIIVGNIFGWWHGLTELQVGFVLYALIFPTVFTSFFIENRRIKDLARFLLGFSFSVAFVLLIFTPNWLVKGWILLNFIPGYVYLNKRRAQKNEEVCSNCSEREKFPYCSGYQIYADRESIFLAQAVQGGIRDPFALPPDELDEQ